MTCREAVDFLGPYADGELDLVRSLALEEHLSGCALCSRAQESFRQLSARVAADAPYFEAPPELAGRLRAALGGDSAVVAMAAPRRNTRLLWAGLAAAALITALGLAILPGRPSREDLLVRDLLAAHIRSLQGDHLVDVPSSDRHTVKPWFAGKLDFSPRVPDLAAQGFELAGGRLDYVDGRPVVALVYRRRQHVINVFIWPGTAREGTRESRALHGYNAIRFSGDATVSWAVSDLNPRELSGFAALFCEAPPDL